MTDARAIELAERRQVLDALEPAARREFAMLFRLLDDEPSPPDDLPPNVTPINRAKKRHCARRR